MILLASLQFPVVLQFLYPKHRTGSVSFEDSDKARTEKMNYVWRALWRATVLRGSLQSPRLAQSRTIYSAGKSRFHTKFEPPWHTICSSTESTFTLHNPKSEKMLFPETHHLKYWLPALFAFFLGWYLVSIMRYRARLAKLGKRGVMKPHSLPFGIDTLMESFRV